MLTNTIYDSLEVDLCCFHFYIDMPMEFLRNHVHILTYHSSLRLEQIVRGGLSLTPVHSTYNCS
jgi:hypothetical protein